MGANISADTPPHGLADEIPVFAAILDGMVKKGQAANIKVILGLTPVASTGFGDYDHEFFNPIIAPYGAAHNIEVVNYGDAMCQCVSALGQQYGDGPNTFQQLTSIPSQSGNNPQEVELPSAAGYAMMTQMAETAIATEYLSLQTGGWTR